MSPPRLNETQRRFIFRHGSRLRGNTLKSLFGFSPRGLINHRPPKRRNPSPPLSLKGAKELWRMFQDDPNGSSSLVGVALDPTGSPGEIWSACEINHLKSWAGRKSVDAIARSLGRTKKATYDKLRRLNLNQQAFKFTLKYVAKLLFIPHEVLHKWTRKASGNEARRVRSYMEGRVNMIHVEDAQWLIENKKRARAGDFPDHPGSVDHYEKELAALEYGD